MNYIKIFFWNLVAFIRRNPLTVLFLILLAVVAPSVFGTIMYILLGLFALLLLAVILFAWRLRAVRHQMEEQMGADYHADARSTYQYWNDHMRDGDVRIHRTAPAQKKVKDDVGEYVDFDEVKDAAPKDDPAK